MTLRLRKLWLRLHRWIGISVAAMVIVVSLSGALLVWDQHVDAVSAPDRYATSGAAMALPVEAYVAAARGALAPSFIVTGLTWPSAEGWPVKVTARSTAADGPRRNVTLYLDPPTGRVLGQVEGRASFTGWLHRLHGNLLVQGGAGRQIVGWIGVAMLFLSLSGIYLWWPRNGLSWRALRWRRSPDVNGNIHYFTGIWVVVPLVVVTLSGIYLSFPGVFRAVTASIADMEGRRFRPGATGSPVAQPALAAQAVLSVAQRQFPAAQPSAIFLPALPEHKRKRDAGEAADSAPVWYVQLKQPGVGIVTLAVEDRIMPERDAPPARILTALAGDRAALAIRRLHDGHDMNIVWQVMVFFAGIAPAMLAVTGLLVWGLRGRRRAG